jgi:hypothetical protein
VPLPRSDPVLVLTCAHSYLGTIFSTPPATDVTSADDDEMD